MTANEVIEAIRRLSSLEELDKVSKALDDHRSNILADMDAFVRVEELRSGKTKALAHDQVFRSIRTRTLRRRGDC